MMKLTITSAETLEAIYSRKDLPPTLHRILEQNTFQERAETEFLVSARARNSFPDWGAGLNAINPTATLAAGQKTPFISLLEKGAGSLNELKEVQLDLDESDLLAYEKVSNTPADRPIISVIIYLKFKERMIDQLRIAATGVSKAAYDCTDFSEDMSGKRLDSVLMKAISEKFKEMITPVDTYMGSAVYRRDMAGVLVERILSKKINGDL